MRFSNAVTIARPRSEVFAFVADPENVPKWNYAIVETRKTSHGPLRVGSTYRQVRSQPSRSEETLEVVAYEPESHFILSGDLGPLRGTLTYDFVETKEGTQLTNTADLEAASGVARLIEPLATGRVRDAVADNLAALKQLLERGG